MIFAAEDFFALKCEGCQGFNFQFPSSEGRGRKLKIEALTPFTRLIHGKKPSSEGDSLPSTLCSRSVGLRRSYCSPLEPVELIFSQFALARPAILSFGLVLINFAPLVQADDPQSSTPQSQTQAQEKSVIGDLKSIDTDAKKLVVTTSEGADMEFLDRDWVTGLQFSISVEGDSPQKLKIEALSPNPT